PAHAVSRLMGRRLSGDCANQQGSVLYFGFILSSEQDSSLDERRNRLNYYGAKELAESFRTVRKNTITIAQEIPEEKYSFRPAPNTRTVGELLAHIAVT